MKKLLAFALALFWGVNLMAETYTWNCPNMSRYYYQQQDSSYFSVQMSSATYSSITFALYLPITGPQVGVVYTLDDMVKSQTHGYDGNTWSNFNITSAQLVRSYVNGAEKFQATATDEAGNTYNLIWSETLPEGTVDTLMQSAVDYDCSFDYNGCAVISPLETDWNNVYCSLVLTAALPENGDVVNYSWTDGTVYASSSSINVPNDWDHHMYDANVTLTGTVNGFTGMAYVSRTDGHCYAFPLSYSRPYAADSVTISGFDMKVQNYGTIVFAWQGEDFTFNFAINSADTFGVWKGNDIILSNCNLSPAGTYESIGIYQFDSIVVTRDAQNNIILDASLLCKNNTKYFVHVSSQESPYYAKYDWDGNGATWRLMHNPTYGNGKMIEFRLAAADSIWFNAVAEDEGAIGFSIRNAYGTYGDPIWAKDSIQISYDLAYQSCYVSLQEKYYDYDLTCTEFTGNYENVNGDGVWCLNFNCGTFPNRWQAKFGLICDITGPNLYTNYDLLDMTTDYRTGGYDPDFNSLQWTFVRLNREQIWPDQNDKYTVLAIDQNNKTYRIVYEQTPCPVMLDTINYNLKADLEQMEYYFRFSSEPDALDGTSFNLALTGNIEPTTFYWSTRTIYQPATEIKVQQGNNPQIADAMVQVNAIEGGYTAEAYLRTYARHCYHVMLTYLDPVAEDTIEIAAKDLTIRYSTYDNMMYYSAMNNDYQVDIAIATADTLGVFNAEVSPTDCSVRLNYTPFTSAFGFSAETVTVTRDQNGIITVEGGILCKDNHFYHFVLSSEKTNYFVGTMNDEGIIEWTAMTEFIGTSGYATGQWDGVAVFYGDGAYINTVGETDGHEQFFAIEDIYCDQTFEKYDTVNFQYNIYYKTIVAAQLVGKYHEHVPEHITIYFVNTENWNTVNAYAWYEKDSVNYCNSAYPGVEMTPVDETINDFQVLACDILDIYTNVEFNNGTDVTPETQWVAGKPYYYNGVWYAREEIPGLSALDETAGEKGVVTKHIIDNRIVITVNGQAYDVLGNTLR
ncbi:MAG: starch-binding protein [Paludibacteraceae bacterium]|nr:starch-binding protein [Paludibacteraceae bacterium]